MQLTAAAMAALNTGFDASFRKGAAGVTPTFTQVATVINSTGPSTTYSWLGEMPGLREWIGDRVVNELAKHSYSVTNREFEATVGVKRTDIEDDNIGVYAPLFEELGAQAELHPDETVYSLLKDGFTKPCYDGQNFFDTDHPVGEGVVSNMQAGTKPLWILLQTNRPLKPIVWQWRRKPKLTKMDGDQTENVFMRSKYLYGTDLRGEAGFGFWQMAYASKADLTAANFELNKTAMRNFKRDNGKPLGIRPNLILVGPSNVSAANKLFKNATKDNGASNEYQNQVEVLEVDWLE